MSPPPRWPYRRRAVRDDELPPGFVEPPPPEPTAPMPAAALPEQPLPPEEPPPSRELWPWLLLFGVVVIAGLAIAWALSRDDKQAATTTTVVTPTVPVTTTTAVVPPRTTPATVRVPSVVGLARAKAEAELARARLRAQSRSAPSTRPVGVVLGQEPRAGARVVRNSVVTLTVSKGPARVSVPDVVGSSEAGARTRLRSAGLVASVFRVPAAEPAGTVVAQAPKGGERVAKGARVRVNVSKGAPTTTAVTVTTARTVTETTSTTTTTATTTRGTTTAPPARPRTTIVPNVRGLRQRAARRALRRAGLLAAVVYIASNEPAGTVLAQFPKPGAKLKRGGRVRINVSLGAAPKPRAAVPDVTGIDESSATSQLENAGFVVDPLDQDTSDPSEDGVVLAQDPSAGTRAPRGSPVTIYVGRFTG